VVAGYLVGTGCLAVASVKTCRCCPLGTAALLLVSLLPRWCRRCQVPATAIHRRQAALVHPRPCRAPPGTPVEVSPPAAGRELAAARVVHFVQGGSCTVATSSPFVDKKTRGRVRWQPEDISEVSCTRELSGQTDRTVTKRRSMAVARGFSSEPVPEDKLPVDLSLGKQQEHKELRKKYITAVMREQSHQIRVASKARELSDSSEDPCMSTAFWLDHRRLAGVARRASKHERRLAVLRAALLWRNVREDQEHGSKNPEQQHCAGDRSSVGAKPSILNRKASSGSVQEGGYKEEEESNDLKPASKHVRAVTLGPMHLEVQERGRCLDLEVGTWSRHSSKVSVRERLGTVVEAGQKTYAVSVKERIALFEGAIDSHARKIRCHGRQRGNARSLP